MLICECGHAKDKHDFLGCTVCVCPEYSKGWKAGD